MRMGVESIGRANVAQKPLSRIPEALSPRCEHCGASFSGRRQKRFCDDRCRTRFHYAARVVRLAALRRELARVDRALKVATARLGRLYALVGSDPVSEKEASGVEQ
jgi:hypothetical protein